MSIEIIRKSASGNTVLFGTQEGRVINNVGTLYGKGNDKGGRYLVEYAPKPKLVGRTTVMVPQKEYFDSKIDALYFFSFQSKHEKFVEAKEAGLDDATAELIAEGKMNLSEALGDMDVTDESDYMENYEEWEASQGGEDDDTPSLEVIMAGGWAAWEFQNEKNAWLDSRL